MTAGTQTLYAGQSEAAGAVWRHSLATALACQIVAARSDQIDEDTAFLAGLLHDVGSLVMLHGHHAQFEKMWTASKLQRGFSLDWEREFFPSDHAWIGASVLYRWHMDNEIVMAALSHHEGLGAQEPDSLVSLVKMGNWIANHIGAGYLLEPLTPTAETLAYYGCETQEGLQAVANRVIEIFEEERSALEGKKAA
jgi:putative nucleotidyltransferase with HDIG domain